MKKIRVIQIGIGHDHARSSFITMKNLSDRFEVVALGVPEGEEKFLKKYEGLLGDTKVLSPIEALSLTAIDAAVIETDDLLLTRYAIMAAEKGLHVQMDKPGGISQEDFERLASIQKKNKKVFHLGYMYRYNPAVKKLFSDVESGKLGEIISIEAQMSCSHKAVKRNWLASFPGGMLYYLGCHLIDLVIRMQGIPEEIIPLSVCSGLDGAVGEDFGMAVLRYKKGSSVVKSSAVEVGGYVRRQLVVTGSLGTVELKPFEYYAPAHEGWDLPLYTTVSEIYQEDTVGKGWTDQRKIYDTEPYDRYIDMFLAFYSMVAEGTENPYSYEYEATLHRAILRACGEDIDYKKEIIL